MLSPRSGLSKDKSTSVGEEAEVEAEVELLVEPVAVAVAIVERDKVPTQPKTLIAAVAT